MNALFGIAAAPTAASTATHGIQSALGALSRPFGSFFQTAVDQSDSTASADAKASAAEATSLEQRVSKQLQELFASVGVQADEEASIRFDETTGLLRVDGHHSATAIEAAIKSNPQLMDDLQRLAELQSQFDPGVSPADWELQARMTDAGATLQWR
ncbi:hypothetical protein [Lacipirellula sp.]|uniref:hypothetical protein n=1 Tax=Lacipirellula sp. TaxID=2691419 RepID=UPI003D0F5E28